MNASSVFALVFSASLIGCSADPAPAVPVVAKPQCGEVMKAPDNFGAADVKRCEKEGFERTDRKGGF